MAKPLVGLTTHSVYLPRHAGTDRQQALADAYVAALADAGALPVLLPSCLSPDAALAAAARLDGLVLTGGGDVDPVHFGEEPEPGLGRIDGARDAMEIALTRAFAEEDRPLLGICRGIQVMNVALGGGVIQHLRPEDGLLQHEVVALGDGPGHSVAIEPGTRLAAIVGRATLRVNSSHHQAVGRVAPDLVVSARSPDGVIEAIEHPGRRFLMGVEWHPERGPDACPESRALLRAFVTECAEGGR
jgi:putative glutamine amidotransferase